MLLNLLRNEYNKGKKYTIFSCNNINNLSYGILVLSRQQNLIITFALYNKLFAIKMSTKYWALPVKRYIFATLFYLQYCSKHFKQLLYIISTNRGLILHTLALTLHIGGSMMCYFYEN